MKGIFFLYMYVAFGSRLYSTTSGMTSSISFLRAERQTLYGGDVFEIGYVVFQLYNFNSGFNEKKSSDLK